MGREKADARPHCLPYPVPVLPFSQLGIFMRFVPLWLPVRDILRTVFRMAFYEKTPGFTVLLLFVAAFTACSYCVIWLDRTMPCALDLVTLMSPRTLADDFADVDAAIGLGIAAGHPLTLALQSRQKQTLMTSYCAGGKTIFQLAEAPRLSDGRDPSAKLAPPTRAAFAVLSSIYNASGGGRVGSGDEIGGAAEGRGSSEGGVKSGDGGWMLDVGANVGFFTAHAGPLVRPAARLSCDAAPEPHHLRAAAQRPADPCRPRHPAQHIIILCWYCRRYCRQYCRYHRYC